MPGMPVFRLVQTVSSDYCSFDKNGKPQLKSEVTFRGRTCAVQTVPRFDLITPIIALDGELQTVYLKSIAKHHQRVGCISIVNYNGDEIYDVFAYYDEHPNEIIKMPPKRLKLGVYWRDIKPENGALHISEVEYDVTEILHQAEIVVGHTIQNDIAVFSPGVFKAVKYSRDTQLYPPYRNYAAGRRRLPKLAVFSGETLGWQIQGEEHSSVEDAQATMLLYRHSESPIKEADEYPFGDDDDNDLDDDWLLGYEGELEEEKVDDDEAVVVLLACMPTGALSAAGNFWKAGANEIKAGLVTRKASVL